LKNTEKTRQFDEMHGFAVSVIVPINRVQRTFW